MGDKKNRKPRLSVKLKRKLISRLAVAGRRSRVQEHQQHLPDTVDYPDFKKRQTNFSNDNKNQRNQKNTDIDSTKSENERMKYEEAMETVPQEAPGSSQTDTEAQNKQIEMCLQIKNSLKRLRRQSETGEEEPLTLQLQIYPETKESSGKEDSEQPSGDDFVDESQPFEDDPDNNEEDNDNIKPDTEQDVSNKLLVERKTVKRKHIDKALLLRKKVKRNPRRMTVIKRLLEEAKIAARNAPPLEKIYLNAGFKTNKDETTAEETSTDPPSTLDHKEQLYEFGKYIAEQLMLFDEKDVKTAQTEIKEVLTKYRLKYKIMHCLSKPTEANVPTEKVASDNRNGKSIKQNGKPATKRKPAAPQNILDTVLSQKTIEQRKGPCYRTVKPISLYPPGQSVTQTATQVNSAGPSVPPVIDSYDSNEHSKINFVLVPSTNPPGFQLLTERVNSDGTVVTQPSTLGITMPHVNLPLVTSAISTHPGLPLGPPVPLVKSVSSILPFVSPGAAMNSSIFPRVNPGPTVSQPVLSLVTCPSASASQPSLPHVKIGPPVTQPQGMSEATVAELELANNEIVEPPETLIVKDEPSSDEET